MDKTPPEVLHQIFGLLEFSEVSALRATAKRYADVGIEYLTRRIRFHCTAESINRGKELANHATIRNHVKVLVMEGNLLADIGCEHSYSSHYDSAHHADEKPQPPSEPCTKREQRLYERNLAKFEREVLQKYKTYRAAWKTQQELIKAPVYSKIGRSITLALPKLEDVRLSTVGRCQHTLSKRFIQDFALDCAMPMDQNSEHSAVQLKHLIIPASNPLKSLRRLDVHVLSPAFFSSTSQNVLSEVFRNLQSVNLTFRLSVKERGDMDDILPSRCYEKLLKTRLADSLAVATEITNITINFDDLDLYMPAINVKTILGDSAWPKLYNLDLDNICGDEEYFIKALQRQPSLASVMLGFAFLETGTWVSFIESLSKMNLQNFMPHGVFEEKDAEHFIMDFVDADAWIQDHVEITMGENISEYVTTARFCGNTYPHPLVDMEYEDLDSLKQDYSDMFSDIMMDSDMDSAMDNSDIENSDSDIPDLEDISEDEDPDDPHTAESDSKIPDLEPMDCEID